MIYKRQNIKEDELEGFLLNPFERSAIFQGMTLQKYPIIPEIDDLFCLNDSTRTMSRVGAIAYKRGEIFLLNNHNLDLTDVRSKKFTTSYKLKSMLVEIIKEELEKAKTNNWEELKKSDRYQTLYRNKKEYYLDRVIFNQLGTSIIDCNVRSWTGDRVAEFVSGLNLDDSLDALLGYMKEINKFVKQTIFSDNFLESEVIPVEIEKEAKAYIEAGRFNMRERILIDYLEKIKVAGDSKFTIETLSGKYIYCTKSVNHLGKVSEVNNTSVQVDIENIQKAILNNQVIYRKTIY